MNFTYILAMAPSGDPSAPSSGLMGFLPMIIIIGGIITIMAGPKKTHEKSELEWLMAFLLCLFGGMLGLHRFYAGRHLTGFLFLISLGLVGIGYAIDFIMILFNRFVDNKEIISCTAVLLRSQKLRKTLLRTCPSPKKSKSLQN